MTTLWCERAWLGGDRVESGVVVVIDGGMIASVAAGVSNCPSDAVPRAGVTIPGLLNAHSHVFHRALRARTQRGEGSFWTWREQMYELAARLDPDSLHAIARATYGEMVLAGITTVFEFHYVHHDLDGRRYADPNAMGHALIEAAAAAGIRLVVVDACYLSGGIGKPLEGVQRRFGDGTAQAWAERVDAIDVRGAQVAAAIHSVRAVAPSDMKEVVRWAHEREVPVHAHVSEQPAENVACIDAYGMTPTQLLHDIGATDGDFVAVHAIHVSHADIALLGGAAACLCPTTERDLADGIAPSGALSDAGARIVLGSDSNAVIDLFEEARAVELDTRLATGTRGTHSPVQLLGAAVRDAITAGAPADLVTIGLDSVRMAGAGDDVEAIVFAATASDVTDVMVGGREVVRGGSHLSIDVPRELTLAVDGLWSD
ncbi:MAG TPA: formimidoylglutamate deiminase [Acidimicrobiales bacterium]|nr:formimidoylglutamate deiminase [Acidimicrobiales bacterium]